jgi:predicted SprT family Zn-dependent metalloprotease
MKNVTQEVAQERWDLAIALLKQNDLHTQGWTLQSDRAKARAGCCKYRTKVISISKYYLWDERTTLEEFKDTVLHEIAHAIAGSAARHGPAWKEVALRIGCTGERCLSRQVVDQTHYKWVIKCPCGAVNLRRLTLQKKKVRRWQCLTCKSAVSYYRHSKTKGSKKKNRVKNETTTTEVKNATEVKNTTTTTISDVVIPSAADGEADDGEADDGEADDDDGFDRNIMLFDDDMMPSACR